jgi:hypothetical protein
MKAFDATLHSLTPYAQGRYHGTQKLPQELEQAYEERCVLHKLHTAVGEIYVPPMAFKHCIESAARYTGDQIPGRGKERYTKHYVQGVLCPDPLMLGMKADTVRIEKVFTSTQPGKPNSGRAWKWFPVIDSWSGVLQIIAVDDIFTPDVIERHLRIGGLITGIGVWRPERGGMWGKFQVLGVTEREL